MLLQCSIELLKVALTFESVDKALFVQNVSFPVVLFAFWSTEVEIQSYYIKI